MSLAARVRSSLRALFQRGRMEREMAEELRFHVEAHARDLQAQGLAPAEALRQARLAFGAVEARKEECRESLGLRLWDELRADLRYGWRLLRQSPGFTAVAVLSLALGIGANTAIYTLAREVLFRPIGVPHPEQLRLFSWVRVHKDGRPGPAWGSFDRNANGETVGTPFPYPLFVEMRKHNRVLEDLVAFKDVYKLTATIDGQAEAIDGVLVTGNFYGALWTPVIAGRALAPEDDTPAAPAVAVLSDAYWAKRFGRSAAVLGKSIRVNGVAVTVVGVNAPEFRGPKSGGTPSIFLPLSLQPQVHPTSYGPLLGNDSFWWLVVMGRIKPGVTDEVAQVALAQDFENAFRATLPEKKELDRPRFELVAGQRGLDEQTNDFSKPLFVLLALAGTVLLIACANLANLLLARASGRQREMSVRLAMGAGRGRVMRQVLTEALLLAFLGGGAGFAAGYVFRNAIPALFEDAWTTPLQVHPDGRVFLFALGLTLLTGLLFGAAPAWRATRGDVHSGLRESGRVSAGRPRALLAKSLVAAQIGLCALLLVGAGLFLRTLVNLRSAGLGLSPEHLLLFQLDPPRARFAGTERVDLFARLEERVAAVPGAQIVTLSSEPLLANSTDTRCFHPADRPASNGSGEEDVAWTNTVGGQFFTAYGIPILIGRGFLSSDTSPTPRVAIVNQTLARKFFPQGSPLGRTIVACERDADPRPIEIVGVSADAKYASLRDAAPPTIYLPYRQADDLESMTFEVKTAANTASMLPGLREAVRSIDPDLPLLAVRTQEQQIDATLSQERVFATLAGGFGALALLLAGIGVYGVMAYTVARRTHEIGIRMALGARAREVLAMVLGETSRVAAAGLVAGLSVALALTRILTSLLFGLRPSDPWTYTGAAALLLLVTLIAGAIPARRAAGVDANRALRHE